MTGTEREKKESAGKIMEDSRLSIPQTVVVEGKYDKIKLSSLLDAHIITCDGFGIFREKEKLALIRRIAAQHGLIVLTDADGAGLVIRNYFRSALPAENVIHLYIPARAGKEKRKSAPSKEGLLGVEGTDPELLRSLFLPFAQSKGSGTEKPQGRGITKSDFYEDGLTGGKESKRLREALSRKASLPENLSANALLEAMNLLYSYEEYQKLLAACRGKGSEAQLS